MSPPQPRKTESGCATCGGTRIVVREEVRVEAGCCGNYGLAECCGNPVPVEHVERWQEPCPDCAPPEAWGA